jgi:antitoxin component YwqK of YwqJK toxin-antitoxin module
MLLNNNLMKLLTVFTTLCFFYFADCYCQPYKYKYFLDDNLNSVPQAKATMTGRAFWDGNGFRIDCFENTNNKLLITAYFTDSTLGILEGPFMSYYVNGKKGSEGNYKQNEMNGLWENWNKEGFKTDSAYYEMGIKLRYAKFEYNNKQKDRLTGYNFKDSLNNTFYQAYFSDKGYIIDEVNFTGEKGLLKRYDSTGIKSQDSVFSREEKEAEFADGGDAGWRNFLQRNLDVDVPGRNKAPAGMYTVVIRFIVEKDGTLNNFEAETNEGYGTEREAIRVLRKSPKWSGAVQYGRPVRAFRRQPITFAVSY